MPTPEPKPTWIQTWSGRAFDLANPTPEQVFVDDIIEALDTIPRFTGHTQTTWSVADHSFIVADLVMGITGTHLVKAALPYALLHDAHEAYLGDWSTPLKNALGPDYAPLKRLEARIAKAIHTRAGLDWPPPLAVQEAVTKADRMALIWERRDLMAPSPRSWGEELEAFVNELPPIPIQNYCNSLLLPHSDANLIEALEEYTPKLFQPYPVIEGDRP